MADKRDGRRFLILGVSGYFYYFCFNAWFSRLSFIFFDLCFFLPFLKLENVGNYVSKSAGDEFLA